MAISKRNHPNNDVSVSMLIMLILLLLSSQVLSASSPSDSSTKSPHYATPPRPGYLVHKKPVYGGRKVIGERTIKIDIIDDYPPARVKPPMPTPCC